ncbi:hypothetical protein [Acaryochloris marina]|uniref:Uncharacterized protein n=1 Tax=Acaryochloris marina (strain MBIC 11017) TaxID=329726 RepID=A8ZLT2_ACAM1|nr:hypothetical protein [Acaryochloris marina]ABW32109.1 hypothetical protein AM1_B0391 [Acaryochloris marina MBIC11017]BDM83092.1 hypothetical protein AM10699_59530 [Acaryochloris marina MBIC10699]
MPILSDFTTIVGNQRILIGDNSNSSGFTSNFRTAERRSDRNAFISFMVRGMTQTDENAEVFVNDIRIGSLENNNGGNINLWHTQSITLSGDRLNDGENTLRVDTVPIAPGTQGVGNFDDFFITNVICHFHQDS